MDMFFAIFYLVFLAFSTILLQIIGQSLILAVSHKDQIDENSWAFGRVVGWLVMGLIIWFCSHFVFFNTIFGFWFTFIFLVLWLFFSPDAVTKKLKTFIKTNKKLILVQEIIFLLGFVFLGFVRMYNPQVLDLEKFMDAGLMQSYLTSPKLPIQDMWLAGEKFNYYTFGHFLGSLMIRFWQVPMEFGYNYLLAFILGLMSVESFALVRILLKPFLVKQKGHTLILLIAGLVGFLLVNFGGNTHPIWYYLSHNFSFDKYWYPDATRFIERTIHEFPAYSYIVSDLHAHVWGMPLVLLTIWLGWRWMHRIHEDKNFELKFWRKIYLQQWFKESIFLGVLLGVLAMTSTWDTIIYGLFLAVLGSFLLLLQPQKIIMFVLAGAAAGVAALVTVSLWLINFTSISQGVFLAYEHSPFWQLLALWSGHFGLSLISVILAFSFFRKQQKTYQFFFLLALLLTALLLLIIPEVIFFKDIYPNHPRANTMFKFTFQAFIVMSLLVSWGLGFLLQKVKLHFLVRFSLLILFLSAMVGFLSYPFLGYPSYYGQFKENKGWDGLEWMEKSYLADYEAIIWLRELNDKAVILEAVGESYTKKARVSVFTGMPTVLGWRVHEWLWRGGFEIPGRRTNEVKTMFEQPLSAAAQDLFAQYQVKYIFIGSQEREVYKLPLDQLLSLGEVIYNSNGNFIIKLF